jgi:hypothetical protein
MGTEARDRFVDAASAFGEAEAAARSDISRGDAASFRRESHAMAVKGRKMFKKLNASQRDLRWADDLVKKTM